MQDISILPQIIINQASVRNWKRCPYTRNLFSQRTNRNFDKTGKPKDDFEIKLYDYISSLKNQNEENFKSVFNKISQHSDDILRLLHTFKINRNLTNLNLIQNLILFEPFWVRSPINLNAQSSQSLIDHLLVSYDVPGYLYSEWYKPFEQLNTKWLTWFILLGQGGSIKEAANYFGWNYSTKLQPFFGRVPEQYSAEEGTLYAWILYKGGNKRDAELIFENPFFSFQIDPTESSHNISFFTYWCQFIQWIVDKGASLSDEEYYAVISCAELIYKGKMYSAKKNFDWKGRSPDALLRAYYEQLRMDEIEEHGIDWPKQLSDWQLRSSDGLRWQINEITNSKELTREGFQMNHCVDTRLSNCLEGKSAIFSLTCNDNRKLTIELDLSSLEIKETSGYINRKPTNKENSIIQKWVEVIPALAREI